MKKYTIGALFTPDFEQVLLIEKQRPEWQKGRLNFPGGHILVAIVIITLLLVATPKITFKPFSVTFVNGWFALGIMFVAIGIALIRYQGYKEGVSSGISSAFTYIKELTKKDKI